jgi:acetyl esterase/lipase
MPEYSASICVSDAMDGFDAVLKMVGSGGTKIIIVGSSSGGQLAALVAQKAGRDLVDGVLLRCPVTSDVFSGREYVPERLRDAHTSASDSFVTPLAGYMLRTLPRDGLTKMPLEASERELKHHPRTWIQLCTNDVLYSDGACYAMALEQAGVDVKVDVVKGWPHTFWLKAPELPRALEADMAMLDGLEWILA